jgi:erythromycin esterase-like protein
MWKQRLSLVLTFAGLVSLAGCGGESGEEPQLPVTSYIQSLDIDYPNNDDLKPILDHIEDSRYIGIAEGSHTGAKGFLYRNRLVKYLYEEGAVDVVAMESGLYDGLRLWQRFQQGEITDLREGMLYSFMFMYAETPEIYPMYRYIEERAFDENPLMLIGFDSRHHSYPSCYIMIGEIETFTKANFSLDIDWQSFEKLAKQTMCPWTFGDIETDEGITQYRDMLDTLAASFAEMKATQALPPLNERGDFQQYATVWLQIVKGMKAYTYSRYDNDYAPDDEMQADTLIWLANEWLPGKNIAALGHNIHLAKLEDVIWQPKMKSAFQHLEERQPGEVYSLLHLAAEGEVLSFEADPELRAQKITWQVPADSFERYLGDYGVEYAFVKASDVEASSIGTNIYDRPLSQADVIADGYFYTRVETPASIDSPR